MIEPVIMEIPIIKRLFGALLYCLLKNLNLRFLIPERYVSFIELLRTKALTLQGAQIGHGSLVRNGVFVAFPKNLVLGNNVRIGPYSRIFNYSMVAVGDDTEIGPGLHVQTNEHQWSDVNKSLAKQQSISLPVKIGSGSYLGANVTVLRGVDVGDQCVVAAGAVIVKSLPSRGVYGGVPAKRINNIEPVKISDPSGSL